MADDEERLNATLCLSSAGFAAIESLPSVYLARFLNHVAVWVFLRERSQGPQLANLFMLGSQRESKSMDRLGELSLGLIIVSASRHTDLLRAG
jgi:hypothetical protein